MDVNNPMWIPTSLLLVYTLFACYYDLKYREVPKGFWIPLWGICLPFTCVMYLIGYYPWYLLPLSALAVLVYLLFALRGYYAGADFWFLASIALFFVQNPVTGNVLMPVSFAIFFLAAWVGFSMLCSVPAIRAKVVKRGFPTMITISLALWLTVWLA